jgi:hypothetical protein
MSKPPFVSWSPAAVPNGAVLMNLQGVDRAFALRDGVSFAGSFPPDAHFRFDPDFKRDTLPVDFFINVNRLMVASPRAVEYIRSQVAEGIEYLPITILDHKAKPLAGSYCIVHPVGTVDCIDFGQSVVMWSAFDPQAVDEFEHLEIEPTRVPAGRQVFRAHRCPNLLLLRRSFGDALVQQGLTGARYREID